MDIIVTTLHNSHIFSAMLIATFVDILLGIVCAIISKSLNSTISKDGLIKHALLILIPPLLIPVFFAVGKAPGWDMFESLVLFAQLIGASENWIRLGLPFPELIAKYLDNEKKKLVKQSDDPKK